MHALIVAAVALVTQFAPIPTPVGVPAASFELRGFHAPAPTLTRDAGRDVAQVEFEAPIAGTCAIAEVVDVAGEPKMLLLAHADVERGDPEAVELPLPSAAEIKDLGARADGYTLVVVCFVAGDPSATRYSKLYHADARGDA